MNYSIILAAGVGQRMRNSGMPKQFLKLMGKPIVVYTLEKFETNPEIDGMIVVCHGSYLDYMNQLIEKYEIHKVRKVIVGGNDRQSSVQRGLDTLSDLGAKSDDIVLIHDGVRPLISEATIHENIRVAKEYGCAMTVHPVTESVIITDRDTAVMQDFKKRSDTYSLTSPQTFRLGEITEAYQKADWSDGKSAMPLLDSAMIYASEGEEIHLVKEQDTNIKITTPDDYYFLKAILELEETKYIFGL